MNVWTTFTPQKVSWELSNILTKGEKPSSDWQKDFGLIEESVKKLKDAGITGFRLVIFPSELTSDGKNFNWKPIDKMLEVCSKNKILVDLCIGPFQYPHYPGIYLPQSLLDFVFDNKRSLDTTAQIWKYGMEFLKIQVEKYGEDKRINGFHLANEWPDPQKVKGREKVKTWISLAFMLRAAEYLKKNTTKPILLNTNIHINDKRKIKNTFGEILEILENQAKLGFDIYPTQNKWKKVPFQKLRSLIANYPRTFRKTQSKFPKCEMYFAEVEAQPWGSGQSWYQLISEEENPNVKVLNYYNDSLEKTFKKYIKGSDCQIVSLWGSDFWLSADALGVKWPLEHVKNLAYLVK